MKIFGIVCLNLIIGFAIACLGILNPEFTKNFLNNQILQISATILGFSLSGAIFLLSTIIDLELKNSIFFTKTKDEIKQNIYFMIISFILLIVVLFIRSNFESNSNVKFILNGVSFSIFSIQICAVFELIGAIFMIKKDK